MPKPPATLDLGCGPNKVPGAWGVDHHACAGVDQVLDLDQLPWDLPSAHFETVHVSHLIEHVSSIPDLMREIHRICRPAALVHITTPHFTSIDSWTDPTHRWHLACGWHTTFTAGTSYLQDQMPRFEHVESELSFRRSFWNFIPKAMIRWKGTLWYEKKYAFRYPARNMQTTLRVLADS